MKRNIIILILMLMLCISLVSAEDIFKRNEPINYKVPCFTNGSLCSKDTVCYLTLVNPKLETVTNNITMTNQIIYHSYTFNAGNTTLPGEYKAVIECFDGGSIISGVSKFNVSSSGDQDSRVLILIIGLCAFIFILLYIAFNLSEDHILFKILAILIAFGLSMLIPNTLLNGENSTLLLFHKSAIWILRFVFGYVFIYLLYFLFIKQILIKYGVLFGGKNEKK